MQLETIYPNSSPAKVTLTCDTPSNEIDQVSLKSDDVELLETAIIELYLCPNIEGESKRFAGSMCLKINSWRIKPRNLKDKRDLHLNSSELK